MGCPPSPESSLIRILVVDDHCMVREGLSTILNREPDMAVIAEAGDGQQAVHLYREHRPRVTLMDLRLPRMNGIEATAEIRSRFPDARVIILRPTPRTTSGTRRRPRSPSTRSAARLRPPSPAAPTTAPTALASAQASVRGTAILHDNQNLGKRTEKPSPTFYVP